MIAPIEVFREFRSANLGAPRRRPVSLIEWIALGLLIGVTVALLLEFGEPLMRWMEYVRWQGGKLALMAIGTPVLLALVYAKFRYDRWRDRGTVPFAFPVTLDLPRWRIYRQDPDALFLTDGRGLLCLFQRSAPAEPLDDVLDAIDPKCELEIDDEVDGTLAFELPGTPSAFGVLRRTMHAHAYLLVIGRRESLLTDLEGIFARARFTGATPQKWRPLDLPLIAPARALRRLVHEPIAAGERSATTRRN